ncbi:accessory Sec system glycosylation chaperone GtfB [Streptococcus suis]|nr:accessory Sec system glycosylation chaperone GtfB [Streptococcus suis]
MIQIYDQFLEASEDLFHSLSVSGFDGLAIVLQDDGFLPEGVTSAYAYFSGMDQVSGKPLYFNQVPTQHFWEITGTSKEAEIWDYDILKGKIFFATPGYRRFVKAVDWYDRSGKVITSDHYNKNGYLFSKTFFDEQERVYSRAYYDPSGREVILENFVTQDIILEWQGQTYLFHGKVEFYRFFIDCLGIDQSRVSFNSLSFPFFIANQLPTEGENILFWQENLNGSVPGNMLAMLANKARKQTIIVQKYQVYTELLGLLPEEYHAQVHYLGFIYPSHRENSGNKSILIVTNSDQLEQIDFLLAGLPEYHFHIAALTEMSQRLMAYGSRSQVTLYPNVTPALLNQLVDECDLYFDINHGSEIDGQVRRAFENNQAIFAFVNTSHNATLTLPENIILRSKPDLFIQRVKQYEQDPKAFISRQRLSTGQELVENYQKVLE